jgi:hypothetical protein
MTVDKQTYAEMSVLTDEELLGILNEQKQNLAALKNQYIAEKGPSFLPGEEQTEKRIEQNTQNQNQQGDAVSNTLKRLLMMSTPGTAALQAGADFTKQIPPIEAGIANPAMKMQEGEFNPEVLFQEAMQGIAKEKVGEFGDLYRRLGAPDWIAAPLGMLNLGATLQAGAKAGKPLVKAATQGAQKIGKLLPSPINDAKVGSLIKKINDVVNSRVGEYKAAYSEAYKPFNETYLSADVLRQAREAIPATRQILDKQFFGNAPVDVKGNPVATVKQANELFFQLLKQKETHAASTVKKIITSQLPKHVQSVIGELDSAYGPIIKAAKNVDRLIGENKLTASQTMYNIINNPRHATARNTFTDLTKLGMDVTPQLKLLKKWVGRINAKAMGKQALKVGGAILLGGMGIGRGAGRFLSGSE